MYTLHSRHHSAQTYSPTPKNHPHSTYIYNEHSLMVCVRSLRNAPDNAHAITTSLISNFAMHRARISASRAQRSHVTIVVACHHPITPSPKHTQHTIQPNQQFSCPIATLKTHTHPLNCAHD